MPAFCLPPPPPVTLAVSDGTLLAVRRVFCVGRNYAEHAREMGGDPVREAPFFFTKPADAITDAAHIPYPPATADLHHEVELVAAIGRTGADIAAGRGLDHVFAYGVGIDLTRRDLQAAAKAAGRPWDMAKGFDFSGPCGTLRPAAEIGHPDKGAITLELDGAPRQKGDLADMIWSVGEVVEQLSRLVALAPGDLVFTGTPAGVGPVPRGATLSAAVEGIGRHDVTVG